MSKPAAPKEFQPVEDRVEAERLLVEGAKAFSSTLIWTKDQKHVLKTHLTLYSSKEGLLYAWVPKEFDAERFDAEMKEAGTSDCYFSVSLPRANVFFRTPFVGLDKIGLCFKKPEQLYKVQRRKDLRFPIPDGHVMKLEFTDPLQPRLRVERKIFDLSAGGLSFLTVTADESVFVTGLELPSMTFSVLGRRIVVTGEVRHRRIVNVAGKELLKVGVIFTDLKEGDAQKVASFVFDESRKYFLRFI